MEGEDAISLWDLRGQLVGTLGKEPTSDRVMRMLVLVIRKQLPTFCPFSDQVTLSKVMSHIPARLVYEQRMLIREGLKDSGLVSALDLSKGTLRVYRAYLNRFLDGVEEFFKPSKGPSHPNLLPCWMKVMSQLLALGDGKGIWVTMMKRFGAYCSARQIAVDAVAEEVMGQYQVWLREESGIATCARYYREVCKAWSRLAEEGVVVAFTFAPWSSKASRYGIAWDSLPKALVDLFELYIDLATSEDPDQRLGKSVIKETTLNRNRETYLAYLGFLTTIQSIDIGEMQVAALFEKSNLVAFHKFAVNRADGKAMAWHMRRMFFLRYLIQNVVSPHNGFVDTTWMDGLFGKTTSHETDRKGEFYTREQIDQARHYLDVKIAQGVSAGHSADRLLPLYTAQFVITFLADHPLRGLNLREAYIGKSFSTDGDMFRVQTKNGEVIEEKFSVEAQQAFKKYLDVRREAGIHSLAVLVSKKGRQLSYSAFYNAVVNTFKKACGIHFTPHCFRYVAVGDALERTGDPIYAGATIGDRSGRVVEKSYNRYGVDQASKVWFGLNDAFRQGKPAALLPPLQRLLDRAKSDPELFQMIQSAMHEEVSLEKRA